MLFLAEIGRIALLVATLFIINYLFLINNIRQQKNPNLSVSWAICGCGASMGKPTGLPWERASATE
ncbi:MULTISPECIES: hypothetical protein [Mesorhizobium]|uniref:hypothetical protein n=1 Tax=Mesorhizobium TaxID=68287 RepID=UPI0010A965ED|nr:MULTISPECIES: hypothetical protein [Mesorhizobium]